MQTPAADPDVETPTWRVTAPQVRKLLAYCRHASKQGRTVTAEELVTWDHDHGRRLFDWDNPHAAAQWRLHQARLFLNRFRGMFDGMRVRAFIHVHQDDEAQIQESGYITVEAIAQHPGMRAQVIDDITRRMKMLASELKMWKLTPNEQTALFQQLAVAMNAAQGVPVRRTKAA